jgi:hypothetical protein
VRLTEFWTRMEAALGAGYARVWAQEHVVAGLEQRTVTQAFADGWDAKLVWRAVWEELELPARDK